MRIALEFEVPFSFSFAPRRPRAFFIDPIRRWASQVQVESFVIALCDTRFNPFLFQTDTKSATSIADPEWVTSFQPIDLETIERDGEWWDLFYKAKAAYDLIRSRVPMDTCPRIPAVRWDGSSMEECHRDEK